MTSINSKYDNGYSQYSNSKYMCKYCGSILINPQSRNIHMKKYHNKEIVRY